MTYKETENWFINYEQPSELDRKSYRVIKVLGRKYGLGDWWRSVPEDSKETIFSEIRDVIRYGDMI